MNFSSLFCNWRKIIISLVCAYDLFIVLMGSINAPQYLQDMIQIRRAVEWHFVLLIVIPLIVLLISTIGLWSGKRYAFIVQFFLFLFQTISYRDPEVTYLYFLGPRFYLDFKLNFPDGQVVLGLNLVAIAMVVLLVLIFTAKPVSSPTHSA